jgi:glycosyltransferase involved in cell wall biosynthesis
MTGNLKPMKIALGINVLPGAYGGGNSFGKYLTNYLIRQGINVVNHLLDDDIDLIIVTENRPWLRTCAFDGVAAMRYCNHHANTKLIVRVNECDERKGIKSKILNDLIANVADAAHTTVFVSQWLRKQYLDRYPALKTRSIVIKNGADSALYNTNGFVPWNKDQPLSFVTHHWSNNWHKGWEIYLLLDKMVTNTKLNISFSFIGNVYKKIKLNNTKILSPMSGASLADALKNHHAYITASMLEPAGMHHIEAKQCGLPILYRMSGGIPEYCANFGVSFDNERDFYGAILKLKKSYHRIVASGYAKYDAETMSQSYWELILSLQNLNVRVGRSRPLLARRQQALLWLRDTALN